MERTLKSLRYPFDLIPEFGTTYEIAPGLLWLRMPLPMALDHINLYLMEDIDGWYVVDTGMRGKDKQTYWQQIFDNELRGKPIKGVIVTHMHPDHIGQSGWICDKFKVPLYMSRAEFFGAQTLCNLPSGLSWTAEQYMRRNGASEERIENSRKSEFKMGNMVEPLPLAYERLSADDQLSINGQQWRVIIGEGHSPEHVCLYCEELKILISGDQVIPRISSNVSVMPMEPNANPLADWLRTLVQFFDLPADTLVVPAHNVPFYGLHERVDALIQHHEDHMVALEKVCQTPKKAIDLLPVMFSRPLDEHTIGMAQGECIAHLHLLMARGLMSRTLAEDGFYYYTTIDSKLDQRVISEDYENDESPRMV